ncbi:hypothetical protein O3P69_018405 [Scylla paramamosain]|uniref:Uncharacterized protein n=1 Tax=Scylla paramamosain TaxID=85552 RepID=A0AAW0T176_SCYPA
MLPQDTSGLLPWRMTVPVLQVFGCFPYKLCATSGPPVFSLPLLLWCIFVHLYLTCGSCMAFTKIFGTYSAPDLGTIFFMYGVAFLMATVTLTPFFMTMRSSKLTALLHDMSRIGVVPREYKIRPKNLIIMLTMVIFMVFATWFSNCVLKFEFHETVLVFFWSISWNLSIFMPDSCFSSLLDLLIRYLLLVTESTVAAVSKLLGPDGSFSGEDDAEAALLALRDLESLILEVRRGCRSGVASFSVQDSKGHSITLLDDATPCRLFSNLLLQFTCISNTTNVHARIIPSSQVTAWLETLKQCFFPIITMFLLLSVLLAIVCPYAILKGTYMGGTTVVSVFFSFYIMGQYCYLGQTFTDKVSGVMARLSPLLTFNMCGWYTLSYSSFLGLMNTVMTYLVIVFQIGGSDISEFSSPRNQPSS